LIEVAGTFESAESAISTPAADRPGRPVAPVAPGAQDGRAAFERIYRDQADDVRRRLRSFSPEFERAVIEDAYGRILSRPGLDARLGELMAVCALTALALPRQLKSHLLGARHCGATRDELLEVITLAGAVSDRRAVLEALSLLEEAGGSGC